MSIDNSEQEIHKHSDTPMSFTREQFADAREFRVGHLVVDTGEHVAGV